MTEDNNIELDEWTKVALSDVSSSWGPKLEAALGFRPNDENIWRIAAAANDYELSRCLRSKAGAWKRACENVDSAADRLEAAILDSKRYFSNLDTLWQREAQQSVRRIQREARKLARAQEGGTKFNTAIRRLIAALQKACRDADISILGVNWDTHRAEVRGRVYNAVKVCLEMAGVPEELWPSDTLIRDVAREIDREGE
jgi:hypothetical protein